MFFAKDHKTIDMFNPFSHLGPKRLKLLQDSWAQTFRDHVLPHMPVHLLSDFYHPCHGRPSNEVFAMLGAMILQQMHDLNDEDTVQHFCFNIQWHYALNISNDSDAHSYVCEKSIWNMRQILTENDLYLPLFEGSSKKLIDEFSIDTGKQRIDSVHICSNMRHMGRIGLFVETIKKFLRNLKRHHKPFYDRLEKELLDRYMSKQGESAFSMVKPSAAGKTLKSLGEDLFFLVENFAADRNVSSMSSYQLMVRLLKEQCNIENDDKGDGKKISIKPNKEIPSDSLQNPSDPDAGYSGHKGKGYQVQIMETYSVNEDEGQKKQPSLITYVSVEPANESDAKALLPAIESTQQRDLGAEEILADSLYGGDENCEKSKAVGVEIVSPLMGKAPKNEEASLADFSFDANGNVCKCPQGAAPTKINKKTARHSASFDKEICGSCPLLEKCSVEEGKKANYLRYDKKAARIAQRRAFEKTEQFLEKYRFRAGVEATMSSYDRKTGVKRLRVRGLKAVSYAATLKALGMNIFRISAFKKRQKGQEKPSFLEFFRLIEQIWIVKDRMVAIKLQFCSFSFLQKLCIFSDAQVVA